MESKTIEILEEKIRQAMLTSDIFVLDELIADDLVWTMHTGQVCGKQDDLEAHRSGLFRFTKVEFSDRQIHFYSDNCVVVTLKAELAGSLDGQASSESYSSPKSVVRRVGCERRTPAGCASHNPFRMAMSLYAGLVAATKPLANHCRSREPAIFSLVRLPKSSFA